MPAKGAATRTIPNCCFKGNSSAGTTNPDVPIEIARKKKWRSLPFSNAILQGTASTAYGSDQSDFYNEMQWNSRNQKRKLQKVKKSIYVYNNQWHYMDKLFSNYCIIRLMH